MPVLDMTDHNQGFQTYQAPPKAGAQVQAKKINFEFMVKVGNELKPGRPGDYILRSDGKNNIIPKEIFENSFEEV